ncbi:hypothetical protein Droror1_Dr00024350 [Drosera rotundifolia]
MATTTAENEAKKPDSEKVILDSLEDDDEFKELQINLGMIPPTCIMLLLQILGATSGEGNVVGPPPLPGNVVGPPPGWPENVFLHHAFSGRRNLDQGVHPSTQTAEKDVLVFEDKDNEEMRNLSELSLYAALDGKIGFNELRRRLNWMWSGFAPTQVADVDDFKPGEESLVFQPVWVRFPGLPYDFHREDHLLQLAGSIGTPLKNDFFMEKGPRCWFMRVCVWVQLSVPAQKGIIVKRRSGARFFQRFSFEGVGVCQGYRRLGHCGGPIPMVTKVREDIESFEEEWMLVRAFELFRAPCLSGLVCGTTTGYSCLDSNSNHGEVSQVSVIGNETRPTRIKSLVTRDGLVEQGSPDLTRSVSSLEEDDPVSWDGWVEPSSSDLTQSVSCLEEGEMTQGVDNNDLEDSEELISLVDATLIIVVPTDDDVPTLQDGVPPAL